MDLTSARIGRVREVVGTLRPAVPQIEDDWPGPELFDEAVPQDSVFGSLSQRS